MDVDTKLRSSADLIVLELHELDSIWGCIQKFPDWLDNKINNNNKHSLRSNTKGYGNKTH